jgi:hypothetical protein
VDKANAFRLGPPIISLSVDLFPRVGLKRSFHAPALRLLQNKTASAVLCSKSGSAPMTHGRFIGSDAKRQGSPLLLQALGTMRGSASFALQWVIAMATNNPRHGYERKRSQLKTKTMGQKHWTKRSRETGTFMDQKKAGKFKSVRREKSDRLGMPA